jgi:nucleoside-diphosphate-sugar epimerase
MKKLLICGERSFLASGLEEKLKKENIQFDCFSRGAVERNGNHVSGDIFKMSSNTFLDEYETIINFILVKDGTVEENIKYIKDLLKFCEEKKVKNLIHISSISVYPNQATHITEFSEIESNPSRKGGYGGVKLAIDHYLLLNRSKNFHLTLVRPGFVYDENHDVPKAGIVKTIFGINILLGDKWTTLPLIKKSVLQDALIKIIAENDKKEVYLLLNNNRENGTKYNFVKQEWGGPILTLPRVPIVYCAKLLRILNVFNETHFFKVVGLFKNTIFDSSLSANWLNISFEKKQFCVIGAGAYGSYICELLSEKYPHEEIVLYEVGNDKIKNESEIGFLSKINTSYTGLQKGRFFGFGGASSKWGGQLFTFTENDFAHPSRYLEEIVEINKKWREKVFYRFNLSPDFKETKISESLFVKTGVWLGYFNRNLYKYFRIFQKPQILIYPNRRLIYIHIENDRTIKEIEFLYNGKKIRQSYDYYFLATGAFETARLLMTSGNVKSDSLPFSDHLSQRVFRIKSGAKMCSNANFTFKTKGTSLITKRIVGEVNGVSFFCHPIYNSDFPFFQNIKKLLFGNQFQFSLITNIVKDIPSSITFAWYLFLKKEIYIYKNEFYFQLDIENPFGSGSIKLLNNRDIFGEKGLEIDFKIDQNTEQIFAKAKCEVRAYLNKNNVVYEELMEDTKIEKYEDTYHPFGIYANFNSIDDYFNRFGNMLIVNTGILPRAGGINSTGAVFPILEEFIDRLQL